MSGGLESLYQELILDHSKRRVGSGRPGPWDAAHSERSPLCGDVVTLQVRVRDGRVDDVGWEGEGCSISMASASVFAELMPGRSVGEVRESIEEFRRMLRSRGAHDPDEALLGDGIAFAGVARYPMRVKCALLAWVAAEAALDVAEQG
jgi:nitrogen fixation protein NifU and related proteins